MVLFTLFRVVLWWSHYCDLHAVDAANSTAELIMRKKPSFMVTFVVLLLRKPTK